MEGHWLTIPEYSTYRNKSVSTIRRYIKSNRIQYKLDDGKYLIFVSDQNYQKKIDSQEKEEMSLRFKLLELEAKIRVLEEENDDLRMLVNLYENKTESKVSLPELPNEI